MRLHARLHGGERGFDGRNSRFYDFMAGLPLRRVYRRLARDVADLAAEGARVLDIGTGPGVLLVELATLRPDLRVTGVDRSADMIDAARRRLVPFGDRAEAVVGDAAELPFPDASFDLIVSSLSLHHWQRPADAAGELRRVLRPGGQVCVYDFPSAPFAAITAGDVPVRSTIRSGIPFAPPLTRLLLTPEAT